MQQHAGGRAVGPQPARPQRRELCAGVFRPRPMFCGVCCLCLPFACAALLVLRTLRKPSVPCSVRVPLVLNNSLFCNLNTVSPRLPAARASFGAPLLPRRSRFEAASVAHSAGQRLCSWLSCFYRSSWSLPICRQRCAVMRLLACASDRPRSHLSPCLPCDAHSSVAPLIAAQFCFDYLSMNPEHPRVRVSVLCI
jgi:hypothetical protein